MSWDHVQDALRSIGTGTVEFEIGHITHYRVHQRVARNFRWHRALLAGDSAHINNPLGGMA